MGSVVAQRQKSPQKWGAPDLFFSGFACHSWLVATLVFGVFGKFFSDCFYNGFISWISALILSIRWATTSDFVVVLVLYIWKLFVCLLRYFCHFCIFCSFYHSSHFWIGDILSMFLFGDLFLSSIFHNLYNQVSLAVSTFLVFLAVVMYVIFSASSAYW